MNPSLLHKRRHKRFPLDLINLSVKLRQADRVEVIDMSYGGVAFKIDRRINIGRPYVVRIANKRHCIEVKSIAVRSEVIGVSEGPDGTRSLVYTAAMRFDDNAADTVADFIRKSILE